MGVDPARKWGRGEKMIMTTRRRQRDTDMFNNLVSDGAVVLKYVVILCADGLGELFGDGLGRKARPC